MPAPRTERFCIAQGATVAPRESDSITFWSTVLRVTRRRSTPAHSTNTFAPRVAASVGGTADGEAGDPSPRKGIDTRNEDDFATLCSIGAGPDRRKNVRVVGYFGCLTSP